MGKFSQRDLQVSHLKISVKQFIGWPYNKVYKDIIIVNLLKKFTLTVDEINRVGKIYGEPVYQDRSENTLYGESYITTSIIRTSP